MTILQNGAVVFKRRDSAVAGERPGGSFIDLDIDSSLGIRGCCILINGKSTRPAGILESKIQHRNIIGYDVSLNFFIFKENVRIAAVGAFLPPASRCAVPDDAKESAICIIARDFRILQLDIAVRIRHVDDVAGSRMECAFGRH